MNGSYFLVKFLPFVVFMVHAYISQLETRVADLQRKVDKIKQEHAAKIKQEHAAKIEVLCQQSPAPQAEFVWEKFLALLLHHACCVYEVL